MSSHATLTEIAFENLFGQRTGRVKLNPDRPTILTGANGSGKSTLLRLVSAASAGDLRTFFNAPLGWFRMRFDSIPDFIFFREDEGTHVAWGERSGTIAPDRRLAGIPDWAWRAIDEADDIEGEAFEEVLSDAARSAGVRYSEFRSVKERVLDVVEDGDAFVGPEWLTEFASAFPVTFITDQRLIAESTRSGRPGVGHTKSHRLAVETASRHLLRQLNRADSAYARASQEIDRDLPQSILNTMALGEKEIDEEQLFTLIAQADERRGALLEVGLLDPGADSQPPLLANFSDPSVRLAMTVVIEASLSKLRVLESLEAKLTALKEFLDDRFAPKKLLISRKSGLQFQLPDLGTIKASQLSSGEQQMLVLAWEILFRAKAGTLVIVDEPEISLHVLWQDSLIQDLESMARATGVRFLMATHSPMIVAAAPELERSLDDLAQ